MSDPAAELLGKLAAYRLDDGPKLFVLTVPSSSAPINAVAEMAQRAWRGLRLSPEHKLVTIEDGVTLADMPDDQLTALGLQRIRGTMKAAG